MKRFIVLLAAFALLLLPTQTAYAADRYIAVNPGESAVTGNGDGTDTYFVLDALAAGQAAFDVDAQWWRTVYDAVKREVQRLAPAQYSERNEDLILLLHSRPMDHTRIASLRFRLSDGNIVEAGQLGQTQALRLAPNMFLSPEEERDYTVQGWFYWARNNSYDIMALDCRDAGAVTIHELAHAFTAFETTTEERERIAEDVVESLGSNAEFMALLGGSSLTPHLSAPTLTTLEDFIR